MCVGEREGGDECGMCEICKYLYQACLMLLLFTGPTHDRKGSGKLYPSEKQLKLEQG